MEVARSVTLFAVAAVAEIGGAYLVWQAVREDRHFARGHWDLSSLALLRGITGT